MVKEVILDFERHHRTGLYEAVMCEHKSIEQLQDILETLREQSKPMLFTRLSYEVYEQLVGPTKDFVYDISSRTATYQSSPMPIVSSQEIAIVSGGSSDLPVAKEALKTLAFYGVQAQEMYDVGVAGLWRIQEKLEDLKYKKIVICVAGMDAALPTVLAGLIPSMIIAVPTSVGYGMVKGGETALNALLCSCAQGLVVVNIDNGFGAACSALRVLNSFSEN